MKILTQDRKAVIEMPREVWATFDGPGRSMVVGTSYISPHIGHYEGQDRAKEVLKEIFDSYRSGKGIYIMPVE